MKRMYLRGLGLFLLSGGLVACNGSRSELEQTRGTLVQAQTKLEQAQADLAKASAQLQAAAQMAATAPGAAEVAVAPAHASKPSPKAQPATVSAAAVLAPKEEADPEEEVVKQLADQAVQQQGSPAKALASLRAQREKVLNQKEALFMRLSLAAVGSAGAGGVDTAALEAQMASVERDSVRLVAAMQKIKARTANAASPPGDMVAQQE